MRWVDHKKFVGVDRRRARPALKFGERRQHSSAAEAPSLASAVRLLRVRAQSANTPEGVASFADRAKAIAELAQLQANTMVGQGLMAIIVQIQARPSEDWRAHLEAELAWMADRLD
jgi:hypothetical protein